MTKAELKKGRVLLAEPFMLDPNFKRTAVLLCEYSLEEGGVGFVMNKPLNMRVDSLIEDFPEFEISSEKVPGKSACLSFPMGRFSRSTSGARLTAGL